jgi:hypothetical protein
MTAYTYEIDDAEAAVSDILGQLDPEKNLLKNTVGIVSCFADFISSGVLQAICQALPFETAGTTTLACAVEGSPETMLLTLIVLTSDDVSFSVGLSAPLISLEDESPLSDAYEAAAARLTGRPEMMFSFQPLYSTGGDFSLNALTKISGGIPNFGTHAISHNIDYSDSLVIHNGSAYSDRCALILLEGDIRPRFFTSPISPGKIFQAKGVVTESYGNEVRKVNGVSVADYLQTLGFRNEDWTISRISSFPFVVDYYNDGTTPVARAMLSITPEGCALGSGNIPVGATLTVGSINSEDVISTTAQTISASLASEKPSGILMYSCAERYSALDCDPTVEIGKVRELMQETGIPYLFAYSGGEICPVHSQDRDRTPVNRYHNYTFIVCAF